MTSIWLSIKPVYAEYLNAKYFNSEKQAVVLPAHLNLYHIIWDLMQKRPSSAKVELSGNLRLFLPKRKIGKSPEYYNYISSVGVSEINRCIEQMFYAELFQLISYNRYKFGNKISKCVELFQHKYNLKSISSDALVKRYQRYNNLVNPHSKRKYSLKKCAK
jgi:hypothetical protein